MSSMAISPVNDVPRVAGKKRAMKVRVTEQHVSVGSICLG